MAGNQPAWQLVEDEKCVSFMNCPSHFIPEWVWSFWDVYKGYHRNRYQMPTFNEQPRKYVQACDLYESGLAHFQMLKADDDRVAAQSRGLGQRF